MIPRTLTSILFGIAALAACKSEGATEDFIGSGTMTSSRPSGSAGGFSATLAADLANDGSGSGSAMAGSAGSAMAGSAMAGSAAGSAMAGSAMAGSAMAGSGVGSAKLAAGSAATPAPIPTPTPTPTQPPPMGSGAAGNRPRVPVTPPAAIAEIKLTLEPGWQRDVGEAATISRSVDVVTRTVLFVFSYGYDDPGAPGDREQYIKWLAEKKILLPANPTRPLLNRQRGAAWYLEGVDGNGAPMFRYLVNYGPKKLICYGSLYKDLGLADTRDEVIIQAKKICESISL